MKKLSVSLILIFSLQGAPLPAQASNGMGDMMSIMMQMFLWMMSGGGGGMSSFSPYAMNPYSMNPYSFGGMNGASQPWQGGAFPGYYGGANRSPYSQYGYGGRSAYNPYSPYTQNYDPYTGRYIAGRNAYSDPYDPLNTPYASHIPENSGQQKTPPVVIQPIIVSPGQGTAGSAAAPNVEVLPAQPVEQAKAIDDRHYAAVPPPRLNNRGIENSDSALIGRWQGVNGEYLELGRDSFHLRSSESDLRGSYQLKNGIMKAKIINRTEPVYMQYRLAEGHLVFRSEDGQMMLFRRIVR